MKLYKIHWLDIVGGKDWYSLKEAVSFAKKKFKTTYYTVGYLIYEDKDMVVVASTYTIEDDGDYSFNDVSMIPKSVVIKKEKI
jgi:hypothetical protein